MVKERWTVADYETMEVLIHSWGVYVALQTLAVEVTVEYSYLLLSCQYTPLSQHHVDYHPLVEI